MHEDLFLLLVLFMAFFAYEFMYRRPRKRYRRRRHFGHRHNKKHYPAHLRAAQHSSPPNLSDPNIAIQYVQSNEYSVRPVMNKSVYPVFKVTERFFKDMNQGHRVIPEMSMGAVLKCPDREGFSSINSKRLDIGVIDRRGNLILAIEYNGNGHFQGNAAGRDAVKRTALNKARVPLIEIIPDDDDNRIIEKIKTAGGIKG